jgi:recombination protein RecA
MDDARSGWVADSKERQKALAAALAQIEKQFGKGSIMRLADGEVSKFTARNRPARPRSPCR